MLALTALDPLIVVIIAANVLGAAMAVPQAAKIVVERRTEGVSAAWAGISMAVNLAWALYAWGVEDWGILPVSAFCVMTYSLIAATLVRLRERRRAATALALAGAGLAGLAVPAAALGVGGWGTAGVVLGAMYGAQLSPAVVTVYRSRDVGGVSVATWVLALGEAALWAIYGSGRADVGVLTAGTLGAALSALVLLRLVLRRPRRTGPAAIVLARA